MTQLLILGDRAYSSWSLRAWLLVERWGLPCNTRFVSFLDDRSVSEQIPEAASARTVPTLLTDDGAVIHDSLAIAEELASRHPQATIWPSDPVDRASARTLAAVMHSGFATLRNDCPMNLRTAYAETPVSNALAADLAHLDTLWTEALERSGGPWLAGDYSAADAFFAPVAARVAGYALPVSAPSRAYVARHLADPAFRRWRAMALVSGPDLPWYARGYPQADWPGPAPRTAVAVDGAGALNDACPYSGEPVTHVMDLDGNRWGFCNAFCRDKTRTDPDAWPAFLAMETRLAR